MLVFDLVTYLVSQSVSKITGVFQEVTLGMPVSGHLWVTRLSGDKSYLKHALPLHTARLPSEV